jgi:hypothetical protein
MCQYDVRCPVGKHRKRSACEYLRESDTRSRVSRQVSPGQRAPRVPPATFRPAAQPQLPKPTVAPGTVTPPPKQQVGRRKNNRKILLHDGSDATIQAGVAYLFDPRSVYEVVADLLLAKTKMRRRFGSGRGHWLCLVLNRAARICDTGTYIDLAAQDIEQGLRARYEMPKPVAMTLAQCAAVGAKRLLSPTVFGPANFPIVLRGLIALVCPNLERCPCQSDVCTTLLGPFAAKSLRDVVGGPS